MASGAKQSASSAQRLLSRQRKYLYLSFLIDSISSSGDMRGSFVPRASSASLPFPAESLVRSGPMTTLPPTAAARRRVACAAAGLALLAGFVSGVRDALAARIRPGPVVPSQSFGLSAEALAKVAVVPFYPSLPSNAPGASGIGRAAGPMPRSSRTS